MSGARRARRSDEGVSDRLFERCPAANGLDSAGEVTIRLICIPDSGAPPRGGSPLFGV
jgi:hypothetical protein